MKRIFIAITILLVGWCNLSAQNLISNSGFEEGTTGWQFGFWGGSVANLSTSADFAHEGVKSVKVNISTATPDDVGKVYVRMNGLMLNEGQKYTLEFYLLSISAKEENILVSLYSHTNIGSTSWGTAYSNKDVKFNGDGEWKKFSFEFTPSNLEGTPDFNALGLLFGFGMNVSTIYLDQVSLSPVSAGVKTQNLHVSKSGNDSGNGSAENPFLSISKAASLVNPGDTVFIHAGTYEETLTPAKSGTAGSPIVFQSYKNEKVIITAMQALTGWTKDAGQIYKTTVDWDMDQQNFVMNGTTACDLARWPNNTDGDPFTLDSKRNTGGSNSDVITNAYLNSSEIPNYDWSKGGSVFFYGDKGGAGWTAWKSFVTSSSAGKVVFDLNKNPSWIRTVHYPSALGDFYLEGIKDAIDYQNEWYFDATTKTLYIQLPGGVSPVDGQVKMRRRLLTVDLNGKNYIEIRNLAVFGGGIEISGSNNVLYGITSLYGNHSRGVVSGFSINSQSVYFKYGSKNNSIQKSEVGFGAGAGIRDNGNNTQILNNYVHDFDYAGDYDAALYVREGTGAVIKGNTVTRSGRDGLQIISKNSEVAFNDISRSNLIADDCGLLYTLGNGLFIKIHHNLFHDVASRGSLYKAAGIYLDNDATDVTVHHNVVWNCEWSAIQQNLTCANNDIFNNTLINCSAAMGAWHQTGTAFTNVRVWNNLTNMNSLEEQADKQNNYIMTSTNNQFTNMANGDFTLVAGSLAIDNGIVINGITDGYVGAKPDVGAYEYGAAKWQAGVDWDTRLGPTGKGCYGLPGEVCSWPTSVISPNTRQNEFKLFPNPVTSGKLQFELSPIQDGTCWSVYSISGKRLLQGKMNSDVQTINMSGLGSGIYILKVQLGNSMFAEKVVKK